MKRSTRLLYLLTTILLLSSFTGREENKFIGTYGVSASDPSQIKLIINPDHTFYYQDFSVSDQKIIVNGTWHLKGGKVILKNAGSGKRFHNVWKFADDGKVARSRKGLTFYILGRVGE